MAPADTPGPPPAPRYRRAKRESETEIQTRMAEWRVVAAIGPPADWSLAAALQRASAQREQESDLPWLLDDADDGPVGWRSALEYACPSCRSRFVWRQRPNFSRTSCAICDGTIDEPPMPAEPAPVAVRVRDLPSAITTVTTASEERGSLKFKGTSPTERRDARPALPALPASMCLACGARPSSSYGHCVRCWNGAG
jgi:hypothetical protein